MEYDYVRCLDQGEFSLQYFVITENCTITADEYCTRTINQWGTPHNCYGPAITVYIKPNILSESRYYINGLAHNEYGPAEIGYKPDNTLLYSLFWIRNQPHVFKTDEITILFYNIQGKCVESDYSTLNTLPNYIPGLLYKENGEYFRVKYWRSGRFIDLVEIQTMRNKHNQLIPAIFIGTIMSALRYKSHQIEYSLR